MGALPQVLVNGLLLGSVYATVALSLWLLWSVVRVVNVAHGDVVMVGAYAAWWLGAQHGWEPLGALLVVAPAAIVAGLVLHRVLFDRLRARPALASVLVTLGLSVAAQGAARSAFTAMPQTSAATLDDAWRLGPVSVSPGQLLAAAAAAAVIVACLAFLRQTTAGKSVRAVAQNPEAARLVGIEIGRVTALAVALSIAIGMTAGVLVGQFQHIQPAMGIPLTVKAFAIVIVAGLASVRGVVGAAVALGTIESLLAVAFPLTGVGLGLVLAATILVIALAVRGSVVGVETGTGVRA